MSAFAALGGFLFLNTLYLQEVRGLSALDAGLYTLPIAAMTLIFSPLSGRLVGRRVPRVPLVVGGLGIAREQRDAAASDCREPPRWPRCSPAYVVFGIGFGMVNPPITDTAVSGMPPRAGRRRRRRRLDLAPGRPDARRGGRGLRSPPPEPSRVGPDFLANSHIGYAIVAGCGAVVLLLGLFSTTERARASARRAIRPVESPVTL